VIRFPPEAPPGFARAASYFEDRARRATRVLERNRLLEAAHFYRSLSTIIPSMPTGLRWNEIESTDAKWRRWNNRAEVCRTLAELFPDPDCRERLLRLAQTYNDMAEKFARRYG
jgi:hypothetical protein